MTHTVYDKNALGGFLNYGSDEITEYKLRKHKYQFCEVVQQLQLQVFLRCEDEDRHVLDVCWL